MELHGFLNVDKPLGWTSHDVVGRLRRVLGTRRIGHAGTLDPAATGVLVVGVGRATRFLDYVQSGSKAYVAHAVLGTDSDTADIDGRLSEDQETHYVSPIPSQSDIERILAAFVGTIEQIPPKYSAVKLGGEPLYRKARRGEQVDVPVRTVRVHSIDVLGYNYPELVLAINCGAGVYVRSLARDIGEALGTRAYLHHLLRTRVGQFDIDSAVGLEQLDQLAFPEGWTAVATAIDAGIAATSAIALDEHSTDAWYHGRSICTEHASERIASDPIRGYTHDGVFSGIALADTENDEVIGVRPRIVLART